MRGRESSLVAPSVADLELEIESNWPSLCPQEKGFALEYIENGFDHREAAKTVGRAKAAGIKLLRKPLVHAYISHLQKQYVQESLFTQQFYEAKLLELYEMAVGDVEVPMVDSDGEQFKAKKFHGSLALNILKERGLTTGVAKPEERGPGGVKVVIDMGALLGNAPVTTEGEFVEIKDE